MEYGGSTSDKDAWLMKRVREERFNFNEGAEQEWSEMWIPIHHREHVTALI